MSDLSQTGQTLLVALINAANPSTLTTTPLTTDDVTFAAPSSNDEGADKNSTVVVSAASGSALYEGDVTVTYDRLDIGTVFSIIAPQGVVVVPVNDVSDYASASDIVTYLNSTYNLDIVSADYIEEATNLTALPGSYTLQAAPGSLVYIGTVAINFQSTKKDLSSIVTNTALGGLTNPPSPT